MKMSGLKQYLDSDDKENSLTASNKTNSKPHISNTAKSRNMMKGSSTHYTPSAAKKMATAADFTKTNPQEKSRVVYPSDSKLPFSELKNVAIDGSIHHSVKLSKFKSVQKESARKSFNSPGPMKENLDFKFRLNSSAKNSMVMQPEDPELESRHDDVRDFAMMSARDQPTARSRSGNQSFLKETDQVQIPSAVNEKKVPGIGKPFKVFVEERLGSRAEVT